MKTVLIAAGHSNTDPGACANGLREADVAVELRNIVSFYLSRAGVPHDLDGKGTENLPLKESAAKARKAQVALEFHCNAATNSAASGAEVLAGPKDMKFADEVSKAVASALGISNRGAKPENAGQHNRLAFVQAGGMIVECFFITNRTDVAMWHGKKWLLGKALADVVIKAAQ